MLDLRGLSEVFRKFQPQFKDFTTALEAYSRLHTGVDPEFASQWKGKIVMKAQAWIRTGTRSVLATLVFAASFALMCGRAASAQAKPTSAGPRSVAHRMLVGTWRVKVQLYDCTSEAPIGPTFASLLTFNRGGTMAGSTTNPGFAVGQRGPDHGIWSFRGHGTYHAKSVALLNFTTPPAPPFNPGFQAGSQTLTQVIEFNHGAKEFTSDATTEFFDVNGQSYRQGCASAVGTRLE